MDTRSNLQKIFSLLNFLHKRIIVKTFSKLKSIPNIITLLLIVIHITQCIYFNLDLSNFRYELDMDEQISFDGVKKIYEAPSYKIFNELRDGNDHRYGRIFWNILALLSYPSYKVFGDKGLIISNRMIMAIIQLFSYLLLLYFFIPNKWIRCLAFSLLLILPDTIFFAHMPKPEPIQLLSLSFFLITKARLKYTYTPFIFLGIALGAKVSSLPIVILSFLYDFLNNDSRKIMFFLKKTLFFYFGLILGEPLFSYPTMNTLVRYYKSTLGNTSHGADVDGINIFSWIKFLFEKYFSESSTLRYYNYKFNLENVSEGVSILGIIVFALITIYIFLSLRSYKREQIKNIINKDYTYLLAFSLSFFLPIFLFVNRLWGHYIHLGLVLTLISLFSLHISEYKHSNLFMKSLVPMLVVLYVLLSIPNSYRATLYLASRTQKEQYLKKSKLWEETKKIILRKTEKGDTICISPYMFYEKSFAKRKLFPFWGPFNFNKSPCKIIFMYESELIKNVSGKRNSSLYHKFRNQYKIFVNDKKNDTNCLKSCYQRMILPRFLDVLFLIKQ